MPPAYRWLLAGSFVSALATFVFPFLSLFLVGRGFSATAAGLVTGLWGAGAAISGPLAGALADRIGRRPTLVGALASTAVLTATLAMVDGPAPLAATALLLGACGAAYHPVASALVADVVPEDGRARAFGLIYWANNVGVSCSFLLGGALAWLGYERLFLVDALTTSVFAVMVAAKIPETRPAAAVEAVRAGAPGFSAVLADRVFLWVVGLTLLALLPFAQFMVAVPLAMRAAGLGPEVFGRVMAVNGLVIALLQPAIGARLARYDPSRVLAVASTLVGLGYGGYALAGGGIGWGIATAVWSVGEVLTFPTIQALAADLAPAALRGRYQGLLGVSFGAGFALAPPLGAGVLDVGGPRALWLACLGAGLAVAVGQLAAGPARRRAALTWRDQPARPR